MKRRFIIVFCIIILIIIVCFIRFYISSRLEYEKFVCAYIEDRYNLSNEDVTKFESMCESIFDPYFFKFLKISNMFDTTIDEYRRNRLNSSLLDYELIKKNKVDDVVSYTFRIRYTILSEETNDESNEYSDIVRYVIKINSKSDYTINYIKVEDSKVMNNHNHVN